MKRTNLFPLSVLFLLLVGVGGCSTPPGVVESMPDLTIACTQEQQLCGGACANLMSDAKNCGACGTACGDGLSCVAGKCALACPKGLDACEDKVCVNFDSDIAHCGNCMTKCPDGNVCSTGKCGLTCQMGLTNCAGSCANLLSDSAHCGDCMTMCKNGQICSNGKCAVSCQQGLSDCEGTCANLLSDNAHCGDCMTVCPQGNVCSNGKCAVSCQMGLENCNGTCANLMSDIGHCGDCMTVCPQGNVCSAGKCAVSCQMGLSDCNGTCANLMTDNAHCGDCATVCPKGNVCNAGKCVVSCQQGLDDCGGVCVNFQTDNANCGSCKNACPMGQACNAGKCAVTCQMGLDECGGVCVNFQTDNANCGACKTACPMGQACAAGKCAITCQAPLKACMSGCADTRFDPMNCGACEKACGMVANASPGCAMGLCGIGACNKDFINCDGNTANGCEVNSAADAKNCGGCGKACMPGEDCCNSGCLPVVQDAKNCGKCGNVCQQGFVCCSGFCQDPKLLLVCPDCTKACVQTSVVGVDFKKGMLDQIIANDKGLTTSPAADNPPVAKSPNVWVCNHASNNVTKIDSVSGKVLGLFASGGGNPSRAAQAFDGSFWVGHRGQNCNTNDPACSNVTQLKIDGSIGCQFKKAADGAVLPFVRAMAIDANGFIWFSTWNDARLHKGDPIACKVVLDIGGRYAYGMSIDSKGVLWTQPANSGNALVTGLDTKDGKILYEVPQAGRAFYGIVVDRKDNIWFGNTSGSGGVYRLDGIDHKTITTHVPGPGGGSSTYGVTIDTDGNIWGASFSNPGRLYKFDPKGNPLLNVPLQGIVNALGMSGDTYGKVWATGYSSDNVTRVNKDTGAVELTVALGGSQPYTYSDWNSVVLRTVTSDNAQAGTWSQVVDATKNGTLWTTADWVQSTPQGTQASTEFKFSDVPADLDEKNKPNWPVCGPFFMPPVNLQTFCKDAMNKNYNVGRYVKTTVRLSTTNVNVQPTFDKLKFYYQQ